MRKFIIGVSLVTALVLRSGSASAVDQLVVGKKLLISTPASGYPKLVYISRDTTTALPTDFSVDPRCLLGPPPSSTPVPSSPSAAPPRVLPSPPGYRAGDGR